MPYSTSNPLLKEENVDESLWDSPVKQPTVPTPKPNTNAKPNFTEQQERDERLKQELAHVRKVNQAIEGVIESLEKAKSNMKIVNQTVGAASSLLNTWTRILSQTEHTQRLVLDPSWHGATQDVANIEEEAQAERQAEVRRAAEEEERRNNAAKRAEEEERRRSETVNKVPRGSIRGSHRPGARSGSSSSHNYVTMGGSTNTTAPGNARGGATNRRGGSGTSRGTRPPRART